MFSKNKILELTQRAQKAHSEAVKIYNCNSMEPLKHEEIDFISYQLNVCFSKDFYQINKIFSYEYIGGFEFFSFYYKKQSGLVTKTKRFRQALHLPHRYVILSNPGDTWVVLMETQDSSEKLSPVICCAPEDWDNIIAEKSLEYDHTIWPSFTDFFEYLVEQEEAAIQKEIK